MANNTNKKSNTKSSGKAKSGGQKNQTQSKASKAAKAAKAAEPRKPMPRGISAIILIAIGAFLIVSLQTDLAGVLGTFFAGLLKGLGGMMGYMVPYILILYAVLQIFKLVKPVSFLKFVEMFGFHLSFILMNAARFVKNNAAGAPGFKETYQQGIDLEGGGLLGMYIGTPVYKAAGMAGLLILAVALLLICTMLLSGGNVRSRMSEYRDRRDEKRETRIQKRLLKREPVGGRLEEPQDDVDDVPWETKDEKATGRRKPSELAEQLEIEYPPHTTDGSYTGGGSSYYDQYDKDSDPVHEMKREQERKGFLSKLASFAKGDSEQPVERPQSGGPQWDKRIPENQRNILDLVYHQNEFSAGNYEDKGLGLDGSEPDIIKPRPDFDRLAEENNRKNLEWDTEGFEDVRADQQPADTAPVDQAPAEIKPPVGEPKGSGFTYEPEEKIMDRVVIGGASVATAKSTTENSEGDVKVTPQRKGRYKLPPLDLLKAPDVQSFGRSGESKESLNEKAAKLERTLSSFKVDAKVTNVITGPSVTRYELEPAIGVKVQQITSLSDDIALSMRARSIRIEAPIPGKAAVGIEIENDHRQTVTLREIIGSSTFRTHKSKLAFSVGRDIGGNAVVADLAKMPHLLIAGATGSGKSVCINTIIASILYKARPEEVKMILIDPKMVELNNYNGIPHLMVPVVTDATKAAGALNWAVAEMTERYKKFAANGVRDIGSFNSKMKEEGQKEEILPQIVIIIDELSDLMMVAKSQVEDAICRLAQLARAAGMHLVIATQRPSVDVITGLIKANVPSRIAFMVSSQIDSRTIIDMPGAEHLVGNGDMLFKPQDLNKPKRIQGPFVSDSEIRNLIDYVKSQVSETEYDQTVLEHIERGKDPSGGTDEDDELLLDAVGVVVNAGQASVSMLQRRFRIGYNRAARIVDIMEAKGIVGPQDGSRPRQVLITEADYEKMKEEAGRLI